MNKMFWLRTVRYTCALFCLIICAVHNAIADPLLWKVNAPKSESSSTIYLFGSIHFGVETMYPLPAKVVQAFDQSDYLAVELNVLTLDPVLASRAVLAQGLYQHGENLKDKLDPATWALLEGVAKQVGIPVESFLPMRPWFVAIQLVSRQLLQAHFREDLGIDRYFLQRAASEKPILELESLQGQLNAFAQFSDDANALFLRQTLTEYEQGVLYLDALSTAWRNGNARQIEAIVFDIIDGSETAQSIYDLLFTQRNRAMVAQIEDYFRAGQNVFLVVGVGHMLGDDGLVTLLKKRGYQVETH